MSVISETVDVVYSFLTSICRPDELRYLKKSFKNITGIDDSLLTATQVRAGLSYSKTQEFLSNLNERESIRKAKGVYYTPTDVVQFIIDSTIRLAFGDPDTAHVSLPEDVDHVIFCKKKKAFDPTCGAGEFLLALLDKKFDLWEKNESITTKKDIESIVGTIWGNDINPDSIIITKLRIYLCAVNRFGIRNCSGLPKLMDKRFTSCDYVVNPPAAGIRYDIIIGNPPYVEDAKCGLDLEKSYGNIYANVLVNAAKRLRMGGAFGFIIPLSYVSTPRMKGLRSELYSIVPEQYILSYSDRPDCLFNSVHQKLCILICRRSVSEKIIYTSNYRYWYKEERDRLFSHVSLVRNDFVTDGYIPKLGNQMDRDIYERVTNGVHRQSILSLRKKEGESVFVNMRAAFWIKAFRAPHTGSEYKEFCFEDRETADYMMCVFNSSLFWWYWVCVSDCWHITAKDLNSFNLPEIVDYEQISRLAQLLEVELERTKVYVGTVQTEYEYKHRSCVDVISRIDDHINGIFGLTEMESGYIKRFAYQYRVSGGATNEGD